MKIRSLTYFDNPGQPIEESFLNRSEQFHDHIRRSALEPGYEIQTIRFASAPFPSFLGNLPGEEQVEYAVRLEELLLSQGYDYLSLGPALPDFPDSYQIIPDLIQATQSVFCSGSLTDSQRGISLSAAKACGEIIYRLAPQDPNGFANLYFAALGNVPAGSPFFPAAYHTGAKQPAFAVAVEAADLAVSAFQEGSNFQEARAKLIHQMEAAGQAIARFAGELENAASAQFLGIDYSLAPFPDPTQSIGTALENLGVQQLGQGGSLAGAAFLADSIDRAEFPRTGFSGLMLPVLEDAVLAARAADGVLGLKDLLLYSAVCGTGLDTVPLPGDSSAEQISAVLIDLAALSLRLDKPLTARLMPIPGKKAGDPTNFDFAFFANSRVLALDADELGGFFDQDDFLEIQKRP